MGCLHTALPQCRCHPPWCRVGVAKEKKTNKSFHHHPPPLQNLRNYTTTACKAAGLAVGPESITAPTHPHRHPNACHPAPRRPQKPRASAGGSPRGMGAAACRDAGGNTGG